MPARRCVGIDRERGHVRLVDHQPDPAIGDDAGLGARDEVVGHAIGLELLPEGVRRPGHREAGALDLVDLRDVVEGHGRDAQVQRGVGDHASSRRAVSVMVVWCSTGALVMPRGSADVARHERREVRHLPPGDPLVHRGQEGLRHPGEGSRAQPRPGRAGPAPTSRSASAAIGVIGAHIERGDRGIPDEGPEVGGRWHQHRVRARQGHVVVARTRWQHHRHRMRRARDRGARPHAGWSRPWAAPPAAGGGASTGSWRSRGRRAGP